jgi:hypothetical protein
MKTDISEWLENKLDKFAIRTGLDVSLMRRGLYPILGPDHINFKKKGFSYLEKDLVPDTINKVFDECVKIVYCVNTIEDFLSHDNLSIKSFQELNRKARKDKKLFETFAGHESVITYSKEEFYTKPDFGIRFYINKSLGEENAIPFMTKLILLEQKLLGLRNYLSENKKDAAMPLYAGELIDYALNHEKLNIINDKITKINRREDTRVQKYIRAKTYAGRKDALIKQKNKLQVIEHKGTEKDLYYGQLASYFLSGNDSFELKNIKKWVDTYIEYETFRTLFAHGKMLDNDKDNSKKFMNMALDYATHSRPGCAFLERIYTNKINLYGELLRHANVRKVHVDKGKIHKKQHALKIGEKEYKTISFEIFQKNYLSDLKNLGVKIETNGTGYKLYFPETLIQLTNSLSKDEDPDIKDFQNIPNDDMVVGSKTNTLSLYGSALFNGILGTALGVLRTLPLPKYIARQFTPTFKSIGDESKVVKFSPLKEIQEIYKFNKNLFTEKFYAQDTIDIIAEKLAHQTIKNKTHFASYYSLRDVSRSYSLESIIQTNSATDVLKNTVLAGALLTLGNQIIDPKDTFQFMDYVHWAPEIFALTWMTFSGWLDKPVNGLKSGTKYVYNNRNIVTDALKNYSSSPLE